MKLTHLGTTSGTTTCPNLYETDRDTCLAQGYVVTDPEALAIIRKRGLPTGETIVEIPKALLAFATRPTAG